MSVALRTITRLQDADDINVSLGAGVDEYALCWDNDTAKFVLRAMSGGGVTDHGALTGLADDDHSQYLLATGARTGASSQAQTFTSGIIGPTWKPAADSTTALQLQNAAGSADILTVDTTNGRVGIGKSPPSYPLSVVSTTATVAASLRNERTTGTNYASMATAYCPGATKAIGLNVSAVGATHNCALLIGDLIPPTGNWGVYSDGGYNYFGLDVGIGTKTIDSILHVSLANDATNTASQLLTLSHNTSGTVAAGFGSRVLWELESSTSVDQAAAALDVTWTDATHASRTGRLALYGSYTGTLYEGLRVGAVSGAAALGFYGVTAIARPTTSSAAASFTANSGTAVNDASTFDGYTIKQIVKALRDIGILT